MKKKLIIITCIFINAFCIFYLIPEIANAKYHILKDEKKEVVKPQSQTKIFVYGMLLDEDTNILDLSQVIIDDRLINILSNFSNLQKVILTNQDMTIKEQADLVKKFPQTTFEFTIKFDNKVYYQATQELDLSYSTKSLEEILDLITLLPNLKKINLSYSSLSNEECNQIRLKFPSIDTNWVVHIKKWSIKTDATAFSLLIQVIDHKNKLTSEEIEVLKYCTKLKALDLGHQAITDISIIGDYLPDLRVLILADNKITDLSPINKLKKLHYLELFLNPITDLSALKENKELIDLNLANLNKISDISPILSLPKLERLWINNSGLDNNEIAKLQNAYPQATITTTGSLSTHGSWRYHPRYTQLVDMFKNNYYGSEFAKYD